MSDEKHRFEIEINAEGSKLAFLSPIDKDGNIENGYRIAGPKAWGGSKNLATIDIFTSDIISYIRMHAPEIIDALNNMGDTK